MHVGNSPLDYVAEALVVDIKVLPAHRTLCPFFEFILTVANKEEISRSETQRGARREKRRLTLVSAHLFPEWP
jgi:hypothetical protein